MLAINLINKKYHLYLQHKVTETLNKIYKNN